MENIGQAIFAWHVVCAIGAGVIGDARRCGFLGAAIAWFVNPLLGLAVILGSDKK